MITRSSRNPPRTAEAVVSPGGYAPALSSMSIPTLCTDVELCQMRWKQRRLLPGSRGHDGMSPTGEIDSKGAFSRSLNLVNHPHPPRSCHVQRVVRRCSVSDILSSRLLFLIYWVRSSKGRSGLLSQFSYCHTLAHQHDRRLLALPLARHLGKVVLG